MINDLNGVFEAGTQLTVEANLKEF